MVGLLAGLAVTAAQAQDDSGLSDIPTPIEVAADGHAIEDTLSMVGLDAAWRSATDLGEIPRAMKVSYTGDEGEPVAELVATAVALASTNSLHAEVVAELRDVALARAEALDDERNRTIDRNRADAHLSGVVNLLQSVAVDIFAGNGESDDILLGTDNEALFEAQRTVELRGHTLEEMLDRRELAIEALAAAEAALSDATALRNQLDTDHSRLQREATALARSLNELETDARGLVPLAATAFVLADVPRATGLTPRAVESYVNAELTLTVVSPSCRISWRTIAAVGAVEGSHGTHGNRELSGDGTSDRPIVGLALNGTNTDNFGEVVASIADTDNGRWDGDTAHDRAVGPMQLIPETWRSWARDGDGDGEMDPQDLDDAALAAGAYLCNYGSQRGWETWKAAVFGYNHSPAYVASVKTHHDYIRRVSLPEVETIELQPSSPWDTYVPMPIPEPEPEPVEGEAPVSP